MFWVYLVHIVRNWDTVYELNTAVTAGEITEALRGKREFFSIFFPSFHSKKLKKMILKK